MDIQYGAPMKQRTRLGTILVIVAAILSCLFSGGCRKSAEQIQAEREAEERARKMRSIAREQARAQARREYSLGKQKGLNREYRKAIDHLDEAERLDDGIELEVQLFRNRMAEDMHEVAGGLMEDGAVDSAERILDMRDSPERFAKYMDKTKDAQRRLEWFRRGYEKLATANNHIANYKTTEGIEILRELVKEYERTLLADKAAAILRTLGN